MKSKIVHLQAQKLDSDLIGAKRYLRSSGPRRPTKKTGPNADFSRKPNTQGKGFELVNMASSSKLHQSCISITRTSFTSARTRLYTQDKARWILLLRGTGCKQQLNPSAHVVKWFLHPVSPRYSCLRHRGCTGVLALVTCEKCSRHDGGTYHADCGHSKTAKAFHLYAEMHKKFQHVSGPLADRLPIVRGQRLLDAIRQAREVWQLVCPRLTESEDEIKQCMAS